MYIQRTNHYTFNEEEKRALHTVGNILDILSNAMTEAKRDYCVADNYNINEEDINQAELLMSMLIDAQSIVFDENVMVAD